MSDDIDERFVKGAPVPTKLGRVVDMYKEVRDLRLAMQKEMEAVQARENELKDHIINNLSKEDSAAAGMRYRAQRVEKVKYNVKDWPAIWAFIFEHKRTDLLQKRLADKAVEDYVEQTEALLPGTERLTVIDISVTKI